MQENWISAKEASALLGVSRQTVLNWIDKGLLTVRESCHETRTEKRLKKSEVLGLQKSLMKILKAEKSTEEYLAELKAIEEEAEAKIAETNLFIRSKGLYPDLITAFIESCNYLVDCNPEPYNHQCIKDLLDTMISDPTWRKNAKRKTYSQKKAESLFHHSMELLPYTIEMLHDEHYEVEKLRKANKKLRQELKDYKKSAMEMGFDHVEIRSMKIEDAGFSTRVVNAFKAAKMKTIQDIINKGKAKLLRLPKLGMKSYLEVEEFLLKKGLVID